MKHQIDQVYVINMDKDKDRLNKVKKEMKKHGLRFRRFNGIVTKELSKDVLDSYVEPSCQKLCTKGLIGCGISHMKVWEDVINMGYKNAIIFEDDVMLDENFNEKLGFNLKELPDDYDILYLGSLGYGDPNAKLDILSGVSKFVFPIPDGIKEENQKYKTLIVPEFPLGLYGYMISKKGCQKFINRFREKKLQNHIDVEMMLYRDGLKVFSCNESIAYPNFNIPSTIQEVEFPRLLDKILYNIKTYNGMPYSRVLGLCFFQVNDNNISLYYGLFLLLGLLSNKYRWSIYVFLISISLDVLESDKKVGLALVTFLIGKIISFLIRSKR